MGSPVSPVITKIYIEHFEYLAIPMSPTLNKWWFRNRWTPLPRYPDHTLNSNESKVYRKLTHIDRYLDYNSNHPILAKLWITFTMSY